ncbi:MAG: FMN-binding protein [Acholeplasmataceae bacterium]
MNKALFFAGYLAILGMFVTAVAYVGYNYTKPIIDENTRIKIQENIALLFDPAEGYKPNENQESNKYRQDSGEYSAIADIYEVLDANDQLYALVYDMQVQGRNDVIHALVAVDPYQSTILGVVYYDHSETPNIGEKYTRPVEIEKLIGQNVSDVEVDFIAGATTTWTALENMYDKLYDHYSKEVHING